MLDNVLVWGDSILKGVVFDETRRRYMPLREQNCLSLAAKQLGTKVDNHAHFGMTSQKGIQIVETGLKDLGGDFDLALIGFGGNDIDFDWKAISQTPDEEHLPNTPPELFEENVVRIIQAHEQANIRPALMTLPPIDAGRYFEWISNGLNGKNILKWLGSVDVIYQSHQMYDKIVRAVAKRMGCILVDVRQAFEREADVSSLICVDGIHPNRAGHRLMAETFIAMAGGLAASPA